MDYPKHLRMENSNHPASQGYNHQVQSTMWSGNKVCPSNSNQNVNPDPYSQQMNPFYQASYSNEMNRYLSPAPSSQYPMARQNNFSCSASNYPVTMKSNSMFYGNVNTPKSYQSKKYNYGDPKSMYNGENESFLMSSSSMQEASMASIPTPPETSSLPGDPDDTGKMNAFVLPGSSISHIPSNMRNACLQPPANLDEGSQASSASASSSIPDEQNSAKTNSKPNFSYPPTPNTLSSPGAASMSSFHDDLECISSPGWPKTPASPVANSNYEFANIKRPENLLKLYTLSDEPDRRYFLDKLIVFNEERGSPITQCPTISKQPLDVFKVYLTVKERGGFVEVTNAKRWKDIAGAIGVGASSSAAYTLRKQYMKLLLPFECKFDRGGIDHQPIITMVEASSRKKGKNTTGAYGISNPYNQSCSEVADNYHANYSSYQSSRYPCNNMEYQCTSNYQPSVTQSTHPNAGQSHYNQYPHNNAYGYYQGNNYNNNTNFQNICRYGNNTAVPQESASYSSPQENSYQDNFLPPDLESYPKVVNGGGKMTLLKAATDTLLRMNSCQDTNSFANKTLDQSTVATPIPDAYQHSVSENLLNKAPDLNYYSSSQVPRSSYSNQNQGSYLNQNCYSNQKLHYQADYQTKEQFGQYSEAQNGLYRGSEETPSVQVDQRSLTSGDIPTNNAKINPSTTQKVAGYNFGIQQGSNKNVYNTSYNNPVSSGPQRTWHPDQNYSSYQAHVPSQRISLKSHLNSPEPKQNADVRKPWRDSEQTLNSLPPTSAQIPATKSQPPTMTVSQAFQSMIKRPLEFPPNSIESVKAVAAKKRRCPAKRLGSIDPWRIMLALKSGLLAESTWALDALAILLADNNTVVYFGLTHLPGLLNVLLDHYRCFLNKIFNLEIEQIKKIQSQDDFSYEISDKMKILDASNYTYKTRCKKKVEIQYDEALFLIDPLMSWDKYEGFDVPLDHWQKGGGDITAHIQTTFDSCSKKIKFYRELCSEEKTKHKINKPNGIKYKGEPVVVLQKFNFLANKISTSDNVSVKKGEDSSEISKDICKNVYSSDVSICDIDDLKSEKIKVEKSLEKFPQLRGSASSRKRFLCDDLEDESYCFDEPALYVINDSQEMLSRRCVCVSTILRNLSFVPGNDLVMGKNSGVLLLLGRLILLHHEHNPTKKAYRKYEKEIDGNQSWNESCISLKDDHEWWWGTLSVLRDNTLVILSNISGQLDLAPFPEEVSLPILDGLLHWVVCPSSYAQDPLPSRSPSVLSPQRLSLEALCKLSILSSNVDLIVATPPWSRIENLFAFLSKSLCQGQDQIVREFALILLSNISEADSVAARTIAEQSHCISYLIAFIEEAEANAFQIALSQGTKKLRDKPELMGTTPGMVKRAANTLKNLALVPENQGLFGRHQARLLALVMSQVMDQELAAVIADVLFYCSEDISSQIPIS